MGLPAGHSQACWVCAAVKALPMIA